MTRLLATLTILVLFVACSSAPAADDETFAEPVETAEAPEVVAEEVDEPVDDEIEETVEEEAHGDHHDKRFEDPEHYARHWNDPARDDWQRPAEIVEAMGIEEGMVVADIGAGTGYFIPYLSEAVGDEGRVIAVDVEMSMLRYIEERADREGLNNVETLLVGGEDSGLPRGEMDRILTVNTWHHLPNRTEYSRHLTERLADNGSVWVVDYREDAEMGPPPEHRMSPEVVQAEMEEGGFTTEIYELGLDRQFVVVGRKGE